MKNGFYLPEYKLTPQAIFQDEILAFDVNFFNPKENKKDSNTIKKNVVVEKTTYGSVKGIEAGVQDGRFLESGKQTNAKNMFISKLEAKGVTVDESKIESNPEVPEEQKLYDGYNEGIDHSHGNCTKGGVEYFNSDSDYHFHNLGTGPTAEHYVTMEKVSLKYKADDSSKTYFMKATVVRRYKNGYKSIYGRNFDYSRDMGNVLIDYEIYTNEVIEGKVERSSARELQSVVSAWYTTFRNIALVALLSVLVYIGIRITLSSVASDKAKYKQMLGDWVVALCLVFLMHYIMSFAVTINSKIIDAISSITTSSIGSDEDVIGNGEREYDEKTNSGKDVEDGEDIQEVSGKTGIGVQLFVIEDENAVDRAYQTLVGDEDNKEKKSGKYSLYNKNFTKDSSGKPVKLFWMTTDFMSQARMLGQDRGEDDKSESQTSVTRAGYNIIYVVLVIYTVIFCFTYLKRVIYMAFLTIIAPLVAITYPIDKINDGKAQAFDMWLKEYIFNLLIQPMHLILYTILVGSAMRFASQNIFYVVIALGFLMPAEKLLRRFFGFEKAQTPGMFAGPAASALMMTGLNKLMHPKPPKGGLGPGGGKSKDGEDEEITKPPMKNKFDIDGETVGSGESESEGSGTPGLGKPGSETPDANNLGEQNGWTTSDSTYTLGANDADTANGTFAFDYAGFNAQNRGEQNTQNIDTPSQRTNFPQITTPTVTPSNGSKDSSKGERKRSIRRAIKRGTRNYFKGPNGLGQKMIAKHKANGGFVRRGARIAGGLAVGGLGLAGAGLIGIASGDPSKAAQYMAAAGAGGYALGKGTVNNISDSLKVDGTLKEAKKAYYGDEYKEHERKKFEKQFVRNEENLRKIEDKLHLERKQAKEKLKQMAKYTREQGINNADDLVVLSKMMDSGISEKDALTAIGYNSTALGGKDTRSMEGREESKETLKTRLMEKGRSEAEADTYVGNLFGLMDKYNSIKND